MKGVEERGGGEGERRRWRREAEVEERGGGGGGGGREVLTPSPFKTEVIFWWCTGRRYDF